MDELKSQYYQKLRNLLPSWFFERERNSVLITKALAAVFAEVHKTGIEHRDEVFIRASRGGYLDSRGDERGVRRIPREVDEQYQIRVRNISNQSSPPKIKALVDQLLINGASRILDDEESLSFFGEGLFYDSGLVSIEPCENAFTVIVPHQRPQGVLFADNGFYDLDLFLISKESVDYIFDVVLEVVSTVKAEGTVFRLIEASE